MPVGILLSSFAGRHVRYVWEIFYRRMFIVVFVDLMLLCVFALLNAFLTSFRVSDEMVFKFQTAAPRRTFSFLKECCKDKGRKCKSGVKIKAKNEIKLKRRWKKPKQLKKSKIRIEQITIVARKK